LYEDTYGQTAKASVQSRSVDRKKGEEKNKKTNRAVGFDLLNGGGKNGDVQRK